MDKREKIAKLLAGKSVRREGSLSFSYPKAEISLRAGDSVEGSFVVTGRSDLPLTGFVLAGDVRMHCLTKEFSGNPAEISYRFDSVGLDEGDIVRGEFKVISNQGEYTLPYTACILPKIFETSLGQMKNLFHFANLARTSWQEAVRVFYDPDFPMILSGNDRQYLNVYRALRIPPHNEQKVEEFLIWIRKKQQVTYASDQQELMLSCTEDITREIVMLTRNGWGYTNLTVKTEGDFLEAEKSVLTDDDFLGNQCACPLLIFRERLHVGCNYGRVRFENEYISLTIPVYVNHAKTLPEKGTRLKKKRVLDFFRCYLLYSMGKISRQDWLADTEHIVEGMDRQDPKNPVQELLRAHILLTRERVGEAKRLLEQAGELIVPEETRPEISCYYLYLTSLVSRDDNYIRAVTEEIGRVYQNDQTNWEVAWLLLYLDGEFARSLSRKWVFLEQQFEKGCRSPIWYLEAAQMVRKHPAFLTKLSPFVIHTLYFMAKYDYLTDECVGQIHYLTERMKQFSSRMYTILLACYKRKKDTDTLHAICVLLIKGNKIGPEYAPWYRKGIEKELWLTRLYEYYMLSVDIRKERDIPAAALRYFSYRSELPDDRTAWLYAYVIRRSREYPDLYRAYLPAMERFLANQLELGQMNVDLACVYRKMIQEGFAGTEMITRYASSLFIHEIQVFTPGIHHVIVVHGKLKGEIACPVQDGRAHVPVYDKDFSLIFEGAAGSRFVCSVSFEDRALFHPQEMLPVIFPDKAEGFAEDAGVLIYQCEHGRSYTVIDRGNARYARELWENREIEETYRNDLGMKLLHYYERGDLTEKLDQFLTELQPWTMSGRERGEVLKCMILRGLYDSAYEWIRIYGTERMTPKMAVRLCSRMLPCIEYTESEVLTELAWSAFEKGKYDEYILQYLSWYFRGTLKEQREVWRACNRFETDSYELCERLLTQMLFTNEYFPEEAEIFKKYLEGSADETLTDHCLTHFAFQYVIHDREPEDFIWKELKRKGRNGDTYDVMCELALLEHISRKDEPDDEERRMVWEFLDDLIMKKGIVLGFFRKFTDLYPGMGFYAGNAFLEYRTEEENTLMLHYMLQRDGKSVVYETEELLSCYPGIYTRSFPLFFGENLEYYIMEKKGDKETLVQSGSLQCEIREQDGGRINTINRLLAAVSGPDQSGESAEEILEAYLQKEYSSEKLFTLL